MGKLDNKVALVTGAARGIGKEIALTLAREGADIVANALHAPNLEILAGEIEKLGRRAKTVTADISKRADVDRMVDTAIGTFGKIDILVCNAGITRFAPFLEMTDQDWDAVLDVDLKGTFLCGQVVARHMVPRKYGKIINVSSLSGMGARNHTMANYAASKAGVNNLSRVMALALGEHGINVNVVAPGVINTEMGLSRRTPAELTAYHEIYKQQTALRRVGEAKDIANVVLFLASDDSSFITGQVIVSDGGVKDGLLR
ncbi:MAG: SDR family oxidoreductase [Betaproteobacteria bacterium]|nr:SDR family oxidoreductase [Betaproteobacteria bacterium]MBK8739867.1 SDR family oxidoreductase [Betaproteobacteria bacterium]